MPGKRLLRKLIGTWPKRLAIASVIGMLVWLICDNDFHYFVLAVATSFVLLTMLYLKVRTPRMNPTIRL